jgi:hypothetical protein
MDVVLGVVESGSNSRLRMRGCCGVRVEARLSYMRID